MSRIIMKCFMYKLMPGRFNDRVGAIVVGWAEVTVANARLGIPAANVADIESSGTVTSRIKHAVHSSKLSQDPAGMAGVYVTRVTNAPSSGIITGLGKHAGRIGNIADIPARKVARRPCSGAIEAGAVEEVFHSRNVASVPTGMVSIYVAEVANAPSLGIEASVVKSAIHISNSAYVEIAKIADGPSCRIVTRAGKHVLHAIELTRGPIANVANTPVGRIISGRAKHTGGVFEQRNFPTTNITDAPVSSYVASASKHILRLRRFHWLPAWMVGWIIAIFAEII